MHYFKLTMQVIPDYLGIIFDSNKILGEDLNFGCITIIEILKYNAIMDLEFVF